MWAIALVEDSYLLVYKNYIFGSNYSLLLATLHKIATMRDYERKLYRVTCAGCCIIETH